jgi:hypothetical protein
VIRIEISEGRNLVVLALSGRIQGEDLSELKRVIESYSKPVVLDLTAVKLVDRETVTFLANFETDNATITNCPPYIHEWIHRERAQR